MTSSPATTTSPTPARHVKAYAAMQFHGRLEPWTFEQRAMRPGDVVTEVLYCGICHTDLHMLEEWNWGQPFPMVPGHEFVGRVVAVGRDVSRVREGDIVAVGVVVDSCRQCANCQQEEEVYCLNYPTSTYGGLDRVDGSPTRGGYARQHICDERFVYAVPPGLELARVAPLLCAGITTFAPLRHWNVGPGMTVGIVGIGGLGHLGVKFARAMGAHVVAFTTSPDKAQDARRLGAHETVVSTDPAQMQAQANRFDFLLDTVSTSYPMDAFIAALKLDGTLCSLGLPDHFDVKPLSLAIGRRRLASSGAGGARDTREMLAFCAEHGIVADVEVVAPSGINEALERLRRNDVKYRFVIDHALA